MRIYRLDYAGQIVILGFLFIHFLQKIQEVEWMKFPFLAVLGIKWTYRAAEEKT